jgi:hypothetical protein
VLQLQLSVLPPKPDELVTLGRRQAGIDHRRLGLGSAFAAVSLRDPVLDGLSRWLELLAKSVGSRPARTRSTICRWNSAVYAGWVLGIGQTPHAKAFSVSTAGAIPEHRPVKALLRPIFVAGHQRQKGEYRPIRWHRSPLAHGAETGCGSSPTLTFEER